MGSKKKTAAKAKTTNQIEAGEGAEGALGATLDEGKAAAQAGAPTLADVAEGYLAWLDKDGAGDGTLSSYRMELKLALRELGEATPLGELTPEQVQAYFGCDAVMRTRHGRHKAKATIDKTRRVLRLALVWAQDAGLIAVAPLPAPPNKAAPLALV